MLVLPLGAILAAYGQPTAQAGPFPLSSLKSPFDSPIVRIRASDNPEIVGAAERAHAYRGNHNVAAFYLVFSNFVIVEFADSGNAAYLYEVKQFETIEEDIVSGSIRDPSDLKRDTKKETLNHLANWEVRFDRELRSLGIYAD